MNCQAGQTANGNAPGGASPPPFKEVLTYFDDMLDHCLDYAAAAKTAGRPIVGIMCEFTPRELILAAGAVPVCLCGGSAATIPAAEQFLPANLCPLIKSTFGYHIQASNPFLQQADLVVAETTCDGKKKMFELLGASKPMYVLELPQRADASDALAYWTHEVLKLKEYLEHRFQTRITDQKLREAIGVMNRERRLRLALAELMVRPVPSLTGRQLLQLKSTISAIPADLDQYQKALHALSSPGHPEVSSCSLPAPGHGGRAPVRVLLTGVPLVHGAERVLELIESCGAVVVAMENCTGLKPLLENVDETDAAPLAAIARKYYHLPCSVMTPNRQRLQSLRELTAKFRPACIIELVWHGCLTYDIESFQVRKLAEEELRLPYLKITTDYSPSDSARIQARVEALLETARAHSEPA